MINIDVQFVYDLRALTGFTSGQELSRMFKSLGLGPSPSGKLKIDLDAARAACSEFAAELDSTGSEIVIHIKEYTNKLSFNSVYLPNLNKERSINRYTINTLWTQMCADMVAELSR